jgi:hypothetical protein
MPSRPAGKCILRKRKERMMNIMGNNLKDLKFSRMELLEQIKANRDQHNKDYEEATSKYKVLLVQEIESLLKQAKEGKPIEHHIDLVKPVQYLREYDRAIRMLEMTKTEEIELPEVVFAQLVMDEWHWKDNFTANTLRYK